MIEAGDIRARGVKAQFQDYTLSADAYGDRTRVWANVGSAAFVGISPAIGKEIVENFQQDAIRPTMIRLRYRSDIAALGPESRMTWNGRTFNLVSVQNINEGNRDLVIPATENV